MNEQITIFDYLKSAKATIQLEKYERVKLTEIATVERAKQNVVYKKGTIMIRVSAASHAGNEPFKMLKEQRNIEAGYAVVVPKINILPEYLVYSLNRRAEEWLHRYVGSNINISMDLFKYMVVEYHPDINTQEYVCGMLQTLERMEEEENSTVELLKNMKKYYLDKMMM